MSPKLITLLLVAAVCVAMFFGCQAMQRGALFHPTNDDRDGGLGRWIHGGQQIGLARRVPDPQNVWLLLHGNGGQAADRVYALGVFSPRDAVYIMEYPGYGTRPGKPSRASFDAAALEAYQALRSRYAEKPVCVAAESIGSGPAATLARAGPPPDKLVFVVPFEDLKEVGRDYVRYAPVGLLLAGAWNNVESLANYRGPMDVYGAEQDEIIDVRHARALAASRPQAKFHLIPGRHNEWSLQPGLRIRNP